MKELKFPLLTKDDIELRIGQMSKDGTKATLLLYQDARCGMKYLDQVVGVGNWQKRYYEVRGLVICSLGIYDEDRKEWFWKDDTGTSGTIEEEKSIISDSFKRCCVCVGLARELYTAPTIWVKVESKYDKFNIQEIDYNKNREISKLIISNEKGEIVYQYPKGAKVSQTSDLTTQISKEESNEPITEQDKTFLNAYVGNLSGEGYKSFFAWIKSKYGVDKIVDLTKKQGGDIVTQLKNRNR